MFENLTERLLNTFKKIKSQGTLSAADLDTALREIRIALLEADVALSAVKELITNVREEALGQAILESLSPHQMILKIVHDHLVKLLSHPGGNTLDLSRKPPVVILLAGLQGSGKTTTAGKLALFLKQKYKKRVALASTDIYRPAAREQLRILAEKSGTFYLENSTVTEPTQIARDAHEVAISGAYDVLIVDTAGRLQIDTTLMDELKEIHETLSPHETLFVTDAMMGQEALQVAKAFNDALPLSGLILTRADSDTRGGAALSVRSVTGQPLKFVGTGEHLENFETFHPDRFAKRILGQGDVISLVENIQERLTPESDLQNPLDSKRFTLVDLAKQMQQMLKMGGFEKFMSFLPGMGALKEKMAQQADGVDASRKIKRQLALIQAMTPKERIYPKLLDASRKRRIARGAGQHVQDINLLLKQFEQMHKVMKQMQKMNKKGNMRKRLGHLFKP
jgi:signal recognition particle subunit SRP54